ncbi:MAG: class I SAM-dependent DNA methyltransferase [Vannielia sp.]|uniref:class I SAM-dependent DNA methyltransferase n=1 Tax=Vannielia sp. TaxID=2813045 RepID=UPI003B8E05F4
MDVEEFIGKWRESGGSERANFQRFADDLTQLLGVEKPKVASSSDQNDHYRFERPVAFGPTAAQKTGFIDLYRRGSFVMEGKQGANVAARDPNQTSLALDPQPVTVRTGHGVRGSRKWDDTMLKARNQADRYARAIAREDGWPPFLLVVDVGHVIEVYADFSGQGQGYTQFPDGNRYRIGMDDLRDEEVRKRLKAIWERPQDLDPSLVTAAVTRDIAAHLAELGKSFEGQGHSTETVARFLMRCLFSMFAEDVELIPRDSFTDLLKKLRGHPQDAVHALAGLWDAMDKGEYAHALTTKVKKFNGGLFKDPSALPLNELQLGLLIEAATADWKQVEPAIFGTLLERALDKTQRHKLGAHYTPRAYVERLVTPTIMEPLRADWKDVQTAVQRLTEDGKADDARKLVHDFHRKLCETKVLDPACGSGNFLYVALEMMKRLEGEVTALLTDLGEEQGALGLSGMTVDPHQFLGIELNPWAANVAELVLWIGYLQWHFRTYGNAAPSEPVLRDFHNIEHRDAVLEWEDRVPRMDEAGKPVTRWDGVTTMRHPVTGEEVPDPSARVQVYDYIKPKATQWPEADFIVGNPPFIGNKRMRENLGDGYVEALWKAYPKMPQSADLVMFWWEKAALLARGYSAKTGNGVRRFGLITTNSLRQTFNRRVLEPHLADPKKPLSLLFAIPDHPWVDTLYGAAVRIAITVAGLGNRTGRLLIIAAEEKSETNEADGRIVSFDRREGKVFANLQIGADVAATNALKSNEGLANVGMQLHGMGFILDAQTAASYLEQSSDSLRAHLRPLLSGRDVSQTPRGLWVLDFFGVSENDLRTRYPIAFQHLRDNVKPERDLNNRATYRHNWWLFGETRRELRPALATIDRYIVSTRTSKHRVFQFVDQSVTAESKLVMFALNESWQLAVLSSQHHLAFALAAGGWLGFGNDATYNHSNCFKPYPFPDPTPTQRTALASLGEQLDAHRKTQQAAHPKLTLTQMYNVLEKLRAGETIEGKDREIYDQGLIGILRDLHDQIDAAVAEAYGWPVDLSDDDILFRLVALNKERAEEEAKGHVRWLRPEYQNPAGAAQAKGKTGEMDLGPVITVDKAPWPKTLPDQIAAVREALEEAQEATPEQIARTFKRARTTSVQPLLESLAALGQAVPLDGGRYGAER